MLSPQCVYFRAIVDECTCYTFIPTVSDSMMKIIATHKQNAKLHNDAVVEVETIQCLSNIMSSHNFLFFGGWVEFRMEVANSVLYVGRREKMVEHYMWILHNEYNNTSERECANEEKEEYFVFMHTNANWAAQTIVEHFYSIRVLFS